MEQTADRLVVIGRGRLIADTTVEEFIADSGLNRVRVRSPKAGELRAILERHGGTVTRAAPAELEVRGMATDTVGELAHQAGMPLLELSPQAAPLETAFMHLTADSVEYRAGGAAPTNETGGA